MRSKFVLAITSALLAACFQAAACSRQPERSRLEYAQARLNEGRFDEAVSLFAAAKSDSKATSAEKLDATVGYLASLACAGDDSLVPAYLEIAHQRDGALAQTLWLRAMPSVIAHKKTWVAHMAIKPFEVGAPNATHYLLGRMMEPLDDAQHVSPALLPCELLSTHCEFDDM